MKRGRQPDKPGTFRIRPAKAGGMRLSGVRLDGTRVRYGGLSASEAGELASKLFPAQSAPPPKQSPFAQPAPTWDKLDDWGFPKVGDEAVASVAETLNLPPPGQPVTPKPTPVEEDPDERLKKERRAKNAKSLMDLGGIAVAWTSVATGRKLCDRLEKDAVKPDTKQTNDLRDSAKEMLIEMFGDSEISPWKMTLLLFIGIPISMIIQSPRREPKKIAASEPKSTDGSTSTGTPLKSVP